MNRDRQSLLEEIEKLADPLLESQGLELVLAEFGNENKRRILRLYIDKPGGVNLDDCVAFSREFNYLLDIHLDIPGQYSLEISSPGINRPLVKKEDFERFKGEEVKIKTRRAIDGQKKYKGELLGIKEDRVDIKLAEKILSIPYEEIDSARLCRD